MKKNKSGKKHNKNNIPISNFIKQMKYDFKNMIDEMSDEEFIEFNMMFFDFVDYMETFEEDDDDDEYDYDYEDDEDDEFEDIIYGDEDLPF